MKKILYLLVVSFLLTSFANAAEITAFNRDGATFVTIKDKTNNYEDWIGIYPKNSSNDWDNVIAWVWVRDMSPTPDKPLSDEHIFIEDLAEGDYEARFFLNNTFETEAKAAFSVDWDLPHYTELEVRSRDGLTWVYVKNTPHNDEDWIGIYPKNSSNDWDNVIGWVWVRDMSPAPDMADTNEYVFTGIPLDFNVEYEARFFLNNTFKTEYKRAFTPKLTGPHASCESTYDVGGTAIVFVDNYEPFNQEDWIGIYPKNSSNDWGNVVAWKWAATEQVSEGIGEYHFEGLGEGEYEARFFLNNTFKMECKSSFTVPAH